MLKYIPFFLLFAIFFSCKKDEVDKAPQFPADLYITNINKKSGIRLFVNKTEIKDQAVIDKFVRNEPYFHIKDSSVVSDEKITFLSADSATIQNLYNRLSIEKNGDKFLFKSVNKGAVSESWARLIYSMLKYKSELGTQWYDQNYRVDNLMVGYGDYSKIELSVFNYKNYKRLFNS